MFDNVYLKSIVTSTLHIKWHGHLYSLQNQKLTVSQMEQLKTLITDIDEMKFIFII